MAVKTKETGDEFKKELSVFLMQYFNLVTILAVAAVLLLGAFFLLKPKFDKVQLAKNLVSQEERDEYENLKGKFKELEDLKLTYQKIEAERAEDLVRIKTLLPDEPDIEDLFTELQNIAEQNGLMVESLTAELVKEEQSLVETSGTAAGMPASGSEVKPERLKDLGKVKVAASIKGVNYRSLKNLIRLLEGNLRLLDIASIDFSPAGQSVSLDLVAYYKL